MTLKNWKTKTLQHNLLVVILLITLFPWEIKILEHGLLDYEEWINHVKTVEKAPGVLMFPEPDETILNKVEKCKERMFNEHVSKYGDFVGQKGDKEKVDFIVAKPDYKNRIARDSEEE